MKEKNELILSTGSVWKISSDTWLNWLIESKQSKIDFYGCSPFYSPFTYQTDNEYRITILEKWKQIFKQKNIEIFSYTPEMRNYPLNLADTKRRNPMWFRELLLKCHSRCSYIGCTICPHTHRIFLSSSKS